MPDDLFNRFMSGPDEQARFGDFGGRFVSETLMPLILELEAQYEHAKTDDSFWAEMHDLWTHYVGRPSPLYYAERLTEHLGGAKIYLKRDELNHTGAHKINNVLGQIILARRMGKTRIIAETGAGQHGVATATVCAKFGLKCIVYMGAHDVERQAPNVFRMRLLGAEVVPVTSGRGTLKDAMNDALRDWVTNVRDTFYCIGTVAGPHPYPAMVRDFQAIIGNETKEQMQAAEGRLPDTLIAAIGGGSNAMGLFFPFLDDKDVNIIGVEAGGKGVNQSIAAHRCGAEVLHIGCVGPDGDWLREQIAEFGLSLEGVKSVEEHTGHAVILVDDSAENQIVLYGGSNRAFTMDQIDAALKKNYTPLKKRCLYIFLFVFLSHAAQAQTITGSSVSANPTDCAPITFNASVTLWSISYNLLSSSATYSGSTIYVDLNFVQ